MANSQKVVGAARAMRRSGWAEVEHHERFVKAARSGDCHDWTAFDVNARPHVDRWVVDILPISMRHEVDGIVQDVLAVAETSPMVFDAARCLGPWLWTMAYFRSVDCLRRNGRERSHFVHMSSIHAEDVEGEATWFDPVDAKSPRPADRLDRVERWSVLRYALRQLPRRERKAVIAWARKHPGMRARRPRSVPDGRNHGFSYRARQRLKNIGKAIRRRQGSG